MMSCASVHTYVGHGLEEGEVVERWEKNFKEWHVTLWAGDMDLELSLVVDTGVFEQFVAPDGDESDDACNFNDLKTDHEAILEEPGDDDEDEEDED